MNYKDLENKYGPLITHPKGFKGLIADLLKKHFDTKIIIAKLYEAREDEHNIFSTEELRIVGNQDGIYDKFKELCDPLKEDEFDTLYNQMCQNHFDLAELYIKQFYEYGYEDCKLIIDECIKRGL